jgi:2-keto-3-deoxy-L-rhamnonate aldolase RhmA
VTDGLASATRVDDDAGREREPPVNENLREAFRAGRTAYGMWVTSESPAVVEVAVELGLDWVCIDLEHGYLSLQHVATHLLAARGSGMTVLVRPPTHELEPTKRVIDLGAHGVILPLVETADEVRAAQRKMTYPPRGERGIGGERNVVWGLALEQYVATADDELLLIPMLETRQAVENLDEIVGIERLEALFLGPGDMSASYGHVGQWEGPGVAEINLDIVERAAAAGLATGVMARSRDEVLRRRDQGFGMVGLGSDTGMMIRGIREIAEALGNSPVGHKWF